MWLTLNSTSSTWLAIRLLRPLHRDSELGTIEPISGMAMVANLVAVSFSEATHDSGDVIGTAVVVRFGQKWVLQGSTVLSHACPPHCADTATERVRVPPAQDLEQASQAVI